jgi:hypothetical protein
LPTLRINLRSATYVTAKKVRNNILNNKNKFKNKNNVITNTSVNSEPDFNFSDNNKFNLILGANYDVTNDFINVD